MQRFTEVKWLIKAIVNLRYPEERIPRGYVSSTMFRLHLPRPDSSLLHRLRTGSTLSFQLLERFGRARNPNRAVLKAGENANDLLANQHK